VTTAIVDIPARQYIPVYISPRTTHKTSITLMGLDKVKPGPNALGVICCM